MIVELLYSKRDETKKIPKKIIGRWFNFLTTKNILDLIRFLFPVLESYNPFSMSIFAMFGKL